MGNITCQIIIDGEAKQITLQEDIATILRIFNKDTVDELTLKKVGEICNDKNNFYIASYQRGYRWGKDEVNALLEDIYEVYVQGDKSPQYCLQPLVVKKRDNAMLTKKLGELDESGIVENSQEIGQACYELLDGQQRLTTLWLILNTLNEGAPSGPMYSVYYELARQVDKNFIEKAKDTIKDWLGCHEEFNAEAEKYKSKRNEKYLDWIEDKRRNYKNIILENLYFIWYEVKDGKVKENELLLEDEQSADHGQSEKLFRKINKGKIELTNAELFKAMLLNDENARTEEEHRELEQISFEWDKIEQSLRNDDFWYFVSNDKSEERTRIDYILEVYARGKDDKEEFEVTKGKDDKEEFEVTKDRYSFLVVQKKLKKEANGFDGIRKVWRDIVHVHDKLYSWYQDNELYHNIGFLVACEGKTRAAASESIVDLYVSKAKADIKEMRQYVLKKIKEEFCQVAKKIKSGKENESTDNIDLKDLIASIDYNNVSKADLRKILLYSNIFPIIKVFKKFEESKKKAKEAAEKTNGDIDKSLQKSLNEIFLERFPFKKYYLIDWDIEHINPREPIKEIEKAIAVFKDEEEKEVYKNAIIDYLTAKGCNGKELEEDANLLQKCWEKNSPEDGKDDIGNLVLLDSSTNRQYHNAIFGYKRSCIIQREKTGKYVLPQTRKVFLKYDDAKPELIEWNENNQKEYEEVFVEMINFIDKGVI